MAELAVTAALGVVQITLSLLNTVNDRKIVISKDDIKSMVEWLKLTKAFIEDNSGCEGCCKTMELRMEKVRDIAYHIEDVLDDFTLLNPLYFFHKHNVTRKVHRFAHKAKLGRSRISAEIQDIKKRIEEIKEHREVFPETCLRKRPPSVYRIPASHEVVGYEDKKRDLIHLLDNGGEGLVRVAVVGPSGSGKTTFVNNVYQEMEFRSRFDCRAWVRLGRHFDIGDIFRALLKEFGFWNDSYPVDHDNDKLSLLQNSLAGMRYFVVLDDVWRETDWDIIQNAFPDRHGNGSRIIVTTRRNNVASLIDSHTFILDGLDYQNGYKLFCRKAFSDNNNNCPSELADLSENIVTRCARLPLAIVAAAGSLAGKPPNEWKRFHETLRSASWKNSFSLKVIDDALSPDYMDLSCNLKSCFLYFSIFPEDESIHRGRLVRLWVAEGFSTRRGNKTAEEVADDHLTELINRNLVHVSDRDIDGRPRNCHVHSHVLKFIIQKCEDENFASIFNNENTSHSQKIRRLSVHDNKADSLPRDDEAGTSVYSGVRSSVYSGVRSVFLMRSSKTPCSDFNHNIQKMKWLKVFDFHATSLTEFPKGIKDLILIKYLSFRRTKIKTIPSSIKKLSYLETLDLKQTEVVELPEEISHLHNLCHLFASCFQEYNSLVFKSLQGVNIHEGINNLSNLQDLSLVKVDSKGRILQDFKKLGKLRKLGVTGLKRDHGKDLCAAVEKMQNLRTLDISTITKEEFLELGEMKNPPQTLQRLYLKGRMKQLPSWILSLDNLLKIVLKRSKLQHSPLVALKRLPRLLELHLVECYSGEKLIFDASTFQQLKILAIEELVKLCGIEIQDGAMAEVKEVSLVKCHRLKTCPKGIKKLKNVKVLNLHYMDKELVTRIGKNGEDHGLVEHIPMVSIEPSIATGEHAL